MPGRAGAKGAGQGAPPSIDAAGGGIEAIGGV